MYLDDSIRNAYLEYITGRLDKKRLRHTLGVETLAIELAVRYGEDPAKAQTAALLHDSAKKIKKKEKLELARYYKIKVDTIEKKNPELLHGPLAACIVREDFGICDEDVLNAISYHTTGRAGMSRLEKIIYLADLLEVNRDFPGVQKLRNLLFKDLDDALLAGMKHVLLYVIKEEELVHSDSIVAYNDIIEKRKGEIE